MLIAAHALSADAVLVTNYKRHYEQIRMPLILHDSLRFRSSPSRQVSCCSSLSAGRKVRHVPDDSKYTHQR